MTCHVHRILIPVGILILAVSSVQASWDCWNCNVRAYCGALGGSPASTWSYFGVYPGATDERDNVDMIMYLGPGAAGTGSAYAESGCDVFTWFERPTWGLGKWFYVIGDSRSPIAEGASKRWGTASTDTWNVKTWSDNGPSGVTNPDCPAQGEYPIAASIYITWEFGVSQTPPAPLPPDDYTFTIQYAGGINPKPAGTLLPDATVPSMNQSWDMEATDHIVIPLWNVYFMPQVFSASHGYCTALPPDTASFFFIVNNPDTMPTCALAVTPEPPQPLPTVFTFAATACYDQPFTFSWDFGDGAVGTGDRISHVYSAPGSYTVTCTTTDADGDITTCTTVVEVLPPQAPRTIYVDCSSTCPSPDGSPECPYPRIQDAIDAAAYGDVVVVLPCTYYENIDFLGKAITVASTEPLDPSVVAATVIDGGESGSVVTLTGGGADDAVLRGFTIRNGNGTESTGFRYGGGIYCFYSSPTIANNTITANSASFAGGGIYCGHSSATITGNTITGNSAGAQEAYSSGGGGIYCDHSSPTIASNTITDNTTSMYGGGIHCRESSGSITDNTVSANGSQAIYLSRSSPAITSNTINDSYRGIHCGSSSPAITNNTITGCSRDGIYSTYSSPSIANNTIAGNDDSGINYDLYVEGTITNNIITENGQGIRCKYSSPTITNNTIAHNSGSAHGAGISCFGSSPTIAHNVIVGNRAGESMGVGSLGGGIFCDYSSSPTVANCVIAGNSAFDYGGGIFCRRGSTPVITNCTITGNNASSQGGGISCDLDSSPVIINCTIADNTAASGQGIGCRRDSSATVYNSVVWNASCPMCNLIFTDATSLVAVQYSDVCTDIGEPWPGEGNICEDPLFVDPASGDYHLSPTSPCINGGWNEAPGLPDYDMDGEPRIQDGIVDMGADERLLVTPLCFPLHGNCRNMITMPGQPINPDPWEVFDELRPPNKPFDLLSGNLHRYDNNRQGYVTYWHWAPSDFGPLTPCEGYWLWSFYDETICYDAVPSAAAEARSLPTIGWYIVGSPHPGDVHVGDTLWHHGADGPHPFSEIMNIWVQDPLVFWSCATGSYRTCGLLPIDNDHYLRAFQGYWLYTFVDDVTTEVAPR